MNKGGGLEMDKKDFKYSEKDISAFNKILSEIISYCTECNNSANYKILQLALDTAVHAHRHQRRDSGEWYIYHPLAVAKTVAQEMLMGPISIAAALLHDVVEDNEEEYPIERIRELFGEKISDTVSGLTKIKTTDFSTESLQAATFKKMLMTIPQNLRVVYIKIADRLHNMRTLEKVNPGKRARNSMETRFVYAPMAHLLGLYIIKRELEDLAFKFLEPEQYEELKLAADASKTNRDANYEYVANKIKKTLANNELQAKTIRITKSLYSTWQKMQRNAAEFDEIHNYQPVRVVFESTENQNEHMISFQLMGAITSEFHTSYNNMRNHIQHPNKNDFRALIVDIMGAEGQWIEMQICSRKMHDIALRGYPIDNTSPVEDILSKRSEWINIVGELVNDMEADPFTFMENFRNTILASQIFVYTPKGDIIRLQKNATVLDFAFDIHTYLGEHFLGAEVNKRNAGPGQRLVSGDKIKVFTSQKLEPKREWSKIVQTVKARNNLRKYFREKDMQFFDEGKKLFAGLVGKLDKEFDDFLIEKTAVHFNMINEHDFFVQYGAGYITDTDVGDFFNRNSNQGWFSKLNFFSSRSKAKELQAKQKTEQEVEQEKDKSKVNPKKMYTIDENNTKQTYNIAQCCNPIAGDQSIAYSADDCIEIHHVSCGNAEKYSSNFKNRVAVVNWHPHRKTDFIARINVVGGDRPGLVSDITRLISETQKFNMRQVSILGSNDTFSGFIEIFVKSRGDLEQLIRELRKIDAVQSIKRIFDF